MAEANAVPQEASIRAAILVVFSEKAKQYVPILLCLAV